MIVERTQELYTLDIRGLEYFQRIIDQLPSSEGTDIAMPGYVYLVSLDPNSENENASKMFSDKIALRDFVAKNFNDIQGIVNIKLNQFSLLERLDHLLEEI
jgi:hypothetical protein